MGMEQRQDRREAGRRIEVRHESNTSVSKNTSE
jgi:hypothetical protein